ncbi:hypothetical protein [Actinoplanes couchii]|uniref:Uncharacterized protein n=1 Tax=Actinoplanes couchii TaxID=403638 RepID=A0ABQ3XQF9_9ACTN|nr:hypothetical protein [Actinoplanes couchii]MDR6322962.1 hypothetical protein [Actinoplanes couchii]GID60637.1 hypothetical protein Aco03nite_090410 [Actinoplanes couchii]
MRLRRQPSPATSIEEISSKDALAIAVPHVYGYWEGRHTHRIQAVNFQIIFMSLLTTSYAGVLATNKNPVILVLIGTIGCVGSLFNLVQDLQFKRHIDVATLALMELQGRLADALELDSVRVIEKLRSVRGVSFTTLLAFAYSISACLSLSGAIFGLTLT